MISLMHEGRQIAIASCARWLHRLSDNVDIQRNGRRHALHNYILVANLRVAACSGVKGKMWATFIPAEPVSVSPRVQQPRGVSVIARDFQTVVLYNADGTFAGIRRPGSNKPIEVHPAMRLFSASRHVFVMNA